MIPWIYVLTPVQFAAQRRNHRGLYTHDKASPEKVWRRIKLPSAQPIQWHRPIRAICRIAGFHVSQSKLRPGDHAYGWRGFRNGQKAKSKSED
jgi:hypothetical protein